MYLILLPGGDLLEINWSNPQSTRSSSTIFRHRKLTTHYWYSCWCLYNFDHLNPEKTSFLVNVITDCQVLGHLTCKLQSSVTKNSVPTETSAKLWPWHTKNTTKDGNSWSKNTDSYDIDYAHNGTQSVVTTKFKMVINYSNEN